MKAEPLARLFHETYERLAPDYGYRTREASAVPWDEVPERNRSLMIATADHVIDVYQEPGVPTMELLETCDGPGGPPIKPWQVSSAASYVLAACVGIALGLAILDLTLAGLLMARALKETTP